MTFVPVRQLSFILMLLAGGSAAHADKPGTEDDKSVLTLVFENDLFSNRDENYTNGVRIAWSSPEDQTPEWARWAANNILPLSSDGNKRVSIAFGQNMYTPEDTQMRNAQPDDRPYAGWLYGSIGMVSDTGKTLDNVMLTLGMVGPASLARQTQRTVHTVMGADKPQGWDNQLHNEPGIILTVERKWRNLYEFSPFGVGVDATPYVGMDLGNINTNASVGTTFRLGYDLPADYGPPRIRPSLPGSDFFIPSKQLGGYLFAGAEGRAVGRNIFLDGNTFEDSVSVDKKYFVGSLQAGIAVTYGATRVSYTQVFMTKEFDQQRHPQQFGALTLSHRF